MGKETTILLFLGLFCLRMCSIASLNTSSLDESSLLALKASLNSDILLKNWSQDTSFCTWIGVTCSLQEHPRVIGLNISNMGLRGTIAGEIGNLSFVTVLDMSKNVINGVIPREIGNLRKIRVLDMSSNKLIDRVPESLGLLREMEALKLSNNLLSGNMPESLSTCVELKMFDISDNNLTGNIPVGFGNLSQLQQLILENNQLTGGLPRTIFNISTLVTIKLGSNQMSGSIPREICSEAAARKLQYLWLEDNQFEGEIPSTLMHCHSLTTLSLSLNRFFGTILTGLSNLSAIQNFGIGRNGFTGTIPPSIGNLSNLEIFDVPENRLYGTIPPEIGRLSSLNRFALDINMLRGEVPESLFNLSRLQTFSLSSNNLSGFLPFPGDRGLASVEFFFLDHNKFIGKISESIWNLSGLKILDLSNNLFSGYIPTNVGNLSQLRTLRLGYNQFANNVSKHEQDFLSSLTNCKDLETISIEFNPITGTLPKSLGSSNLSASLQQLTADSCRITGPLWNEIGNLTNLVGLSLGDNGLTGGLPDALGDLRNLQKLDLYGNEMQGEISDILCKLENAYHVDLSENSFSGEVPECLWSLSKLTEISFAYNAFTSSIPSTLWSNEWIRKLNLSHNFLDGSLSQEIGNMKSLTELDLSGNQISGKIPSAISELQSLIHFSLSNNKMDGPIFESFASLKVLQHLDLSRNHFSGPIPKSFEELMYLRYFNVSFNELSGEIPDGGPFVNFTGEFFVGNKGLCGAPRLKVATCKSRTSSKNKLLKYILPSIASVLIAVFFLILVLRCRRRKLSSSSSFSYLPLVLTQERISYQDVLHATSNLDDKNLIGKGGIGSVYKGDFSNGTVAAIKVFNLDIHDALKSFDTECQLLRSIRHRNLVKVITSCSNFDFKALVMSYMPNGNLENCLYSSNCSMNIFQRLGIMIDVASAIEYLHEDSAFPIAHCDLKPNNILLDKDMVAHVGDFGIAKLLTQEQRIHQTTTLGTIGYMAPEYGSDGLISTMVDVYSYGILLMETFSKRKPTDAMFSGELTMRKWVSESYPSSVMHIVDDELLHIKDESTREIHLRCLTSIIEVALDCTVDSPEERPNMKEVLARINKIMFNLTKCISNNELESK